MRSKLREDRDTNQNSGILGFGMVKNSHAKKMIKKKENNATRASDSTPQQEVGEWLISAFSKKLGLQLVKKRKYLSNGGWIELDGFSESPIVLCEAWAHIGKVKPAQSSKVMKDALKLLFFNTLIEAGGKHRLILLFADLEAASHFQDRSWRALCLRHYKIEVEVIPLPKELNDKVLDAQKRQYR